MTSNETLATLALTRLNGISQSVAMQLIRTLGTASAIIHDGRLPEGLAPKMSERIKKALEGRDEALRWAAEELSFCNEKGISVLAYANDDYPTLLRQCDDPPLALFSLGNANLNSPHTVAVVGTRRITEYGRELCRQFCADLRKLLPDALVISGLAYGVDINAHRAALKEGLKTVGVLAHGLDTIYPSIHRATASQMVKAGGLLTEYPRMTKPHAGNFVQRNRIVAGISAATVVVESAARGGALITARLAQDYNRTVFAFPGRVTDQYSEGCNHLIRDNGAALITSAQDLVEAMNWQTATTAKTIQREMFPELSKEEMQLCSLLSKDEHKQINQLVVESDMPIQQVSALLFELEMKGVIRAIGGGCYRLLA